jgi:sugar lactone lactonase YvrE
MLQPLPAGSMRHRPRQHFVDLCEDHMALTTMPLGDLTAWGEGLHRPEDVAVSKDGAVYASDANAAISEILPDGSLRLIGRAGGEPNGINLTTDGSTMIIANYDAHVVQACDLASGVVTTICDRVGDRPLRRPNYPIVARNGSIYCASSTQADGFMERIADGEPDGYIFRITPDGSAELLVDNVLFPNGLALDADERHLYVCRTSTGDVVRFPIRDDGRLGAQEAFGPPMGDRKPDEWGDKAKRLIWGDNIECSLANADLSVLFRWGLADGCAFDVEGNLWVTAVSANRIHAITSDQEMITVVDDPGGKLMAFPTNVSFGGSDMRDVYFGSIATGYVVKGRSPVPGLKLAGQR